MYFHIIVRQMARCEGSSGILHLGIGSSQESFLYISNRIITCLVKISNFSFTTVLSRKTFVENFVIPECDENILIRKIANCGRSSIYMQC